MREIYILSIQAFLSATQHVRTRRKASASKQKSTVFFRGRTQLYWLFQISPNPPRASGAWRHSRSLAPFPIPG